MKPEVFGKKQVTISYSSAVHCNLTDFNGQERGNENNIDNPQLREIQLYPGDRNPECNTPVLNISINDEPVNAVIDTAAQVTLMSEEFAKKRLDFLKQPDGVIDLTDLSITIRGQKHLINEVKAENCSFKVCRITLDETLIVSPNSTVRLPVNLSEAFENEVTIQPSRSLNGLIMPNILPKADFTKVWNSFEDDVDYIVPLSERSVSKQIGDEVNLDSLVYCNWISESEIANMETEQREDQDLLNRLIIWFEDKKEPEEHELYLCSPSIKHIWNCKHQLVLKDGLLCYKCVFLKRRKEDNETPGGWSDLLFALPYSNCDSSAVQLDLSGEKSVNRDSSAVRLDLDSENIINHDGDAVLLDLDKKSSVLFPLLKIL
ncbi:unnamed protein product [Mytilus coruscus]|uniref:Peptidase A2 domain-containing protein n=1 Tax=Mytilus coruscus TaxID=42192 RepID=A0A6J8CRJ1_MYTCO|nr:unnamed protein product [Mytilus coruscus]